METTKNKNYIILPLFISLIMVCVFLNHEAIIPQGSAILLSVLLIGLAFYFVPFRMLKYRDVIISKSMDFVSNILMGVTCGYINVLLFANSRDIITYGQVLVIINGFFSYYILYIQKQNSKKVFVIHFIVSSFLMGLLNFMK